MTLVFSLNAVELCKWFIVYWLVNVLTQIPIKFVRIGYVPRRSDVRHWFIYMWYVPIESPILTTLQSGFTIPILEEIVFFALPLLVSPWLSLLTAVLWAILHIGGWVDNVLELVPSSRGRRREVLKVVLVGLIHFGSLALVSWYMWSRGYGLASVLGHIINNLVATINEIRTEKKVKRARLRRFCGYLERYL